MALRIGAVASVCNHPLMYIVLCVLQGFNQWLRNIKAYVKFLFYWIYNLLDICFNLVSTVCIYFRRSEYLKYVFGFIPFSNI